MRHHLCSQCDVSALPMASTWLIATSFLYSLRGPSPSTACEACPWTGLSSASVTKSSSLSAECERSLAGVLLIGLHNRSLLTTDPALVREYARLRGQ
jgi:hypothetical protein